MQPDAAQENATETTQAAENASPDVAPPETDENASTANSDGNADVFPRSYVEELRQESGRYRERAKSAENRCADLERQLFTERVAATGRLADPADLPFDAEHLDDADALNAAIDTLLANKPHFKARRVSGDIGQGSRGDLDAGVNLLEMLRGGR